VHPYRRNQSSRCVQRADTRQPQLADVAAGYVSSIYPTSRRDLDEVHRYWAVTTRRWSRPNVPTVKSKHC